MWVPKPKTKQIRCLQKKGKKLKPQAFNILKPTIFLFPPNTPYQTQRCQIPNVRWLFPQPVPPSHQKIEYSLRKNPSNPKWSKNKVTPMIGPLIVDQKMVRWFPITPAHAMLIHKGINSPPQVVSNEYFPPRCRPNKERKPAKRPWPPKSLSKGR